ncbi:MAG: sigma-54-dependent Fis family transcriptional regulator [Chromatiales bacterium]
MKPLQSWHSELPAPVHLTRASKEIAAAWESFINDGTIPGPAPRPVVLEGWMRCREQGINPHAERASIGMTPEELQSILHSDELGRVGKSILDRFQKLMGGIGHVAVLADAHGLILYEVGHPEIQARLADINLTTGTLWSEQMVGLNGVGTPLALGRPELVFGHEHYCKGWQPWVCYGSPVRDPDSGRIVGVIDITGPARSASAQMMALTMSIAQLVEQNWVIVEHQKGDALRSLYRDLERRWPSDGLVLLNETARVIEINHTAAARLGVVATIFMNRTLSDIAPDLWNALQAPLAAAEPAEKRIDLTAGFRESRSLQCRVEPVRIDHRHLGSVLILSDLHPLAKPLVSVRPSGRAARYTFSDIQGENASILSALKLASAAAHDPRENPVLLLGETGTGKELVVHAIHAASARASHPFVVMNCGALPRDLIESELFGYSPGAFTGARRDGQMGKFEAAHKGTLFLDEIDSLPLDFQAKFLRVLEEGELMRLGSTNPVYVDVRLIAAASPELPRRVEKGEFRLDLYHRLSVIEITLPPLRARGEDVLRLAAAFLNAASLEARREVPRLSPTTARCLMAYLWPGNIRELRNLCARWVLTVEGSEILPEHLPPYIRSAADDPTPAVDIATDLRGVQQDLIRRTLEESGGNITEAARRLGIDRTTLYRYKKRWDLT